MDNQINVGKKLKILRQLRELSLKKVAEETKMSYSYLWGLENDKHSISLTNLQRLSKYFQVDLIYFLDSSTKGQTEFIAGKDVAEIVTQDNVSFRYMTDDVNSRLQVTRVHLPKESPSEKHIHHHQEGEEFITVLEGRLYVIVGDQEYELGPDDSVVFHSNLDHVIFTKDQAADFFLIATPPYGRKKELGV